MTYKNYRIEPSKVSGYEAYNMLDCDEPMIICETVEEIVEIINEKNSDNVIIPKNKKGYNKVLFAFFIVFLIFLSAVLSVLFLNYFEIKTFSLTYFITSFVTSIITISFIEKIKKKN